MASITPLVFFLVLTGGLLPAIFWLWFWLREDQRKPEPHGLIILTFLVGAVSILAVFPLQRYAGILIGAGFWLIIVWAGIEEVIKLVAVFVATYHRKALDEPVDYMIYLVVGALGFAAFENSLFLLKSFSEDSFQGSLMTLALRFVGATLVHVLASSVLGGIYSLAFCKNRFWKVAHMIAGLLAATLLHALFNFYIMSSVNILFILVGLWLLIIGLLLFFEKVKHIVCTVPFRRKTLSTKS